MHVCWTWFTVSVRTGWYRFSPSLRCCCCSLTACQSCLPLQPSSASPSSPVLIDTLKQPTCLVRSLVPTSVSVFRAPCGPPAWFLADRILTVAFMLQCCVHLLSSVMLCIVAKRCVLEQKLLLTAYKQSHMKNRLVPNEWPWPLFRGCLRSCQPLCHIRHWISRKQLEIETWFQRTINKKWLMRKRMVTWLMTSRDPERSNSWPPYV